MKLNNNQQAFFVLVRAGLWETEARLSQFNDVDFSQVLKLAEEQSVVGLIAAGLEHVTDVKAPKEELLQFVGQALQLEQQNSAMNNFIGVIVEKMRAASIYTLLVKGQGIAQCYERPLWRSYGDIDFYLSESNYQLAKEYLKPLAAHLSEEDKKRLHIAITIEPWIVELHGTLHSNFSRRMNKGLDEVHKSIFYGGDVRSWNNDGFTVFLPSVDNDVVIVFTHFIQHFYVGGIGIRQICDWCRLLWTCRGKIDVVLLEKRLRKMDLLSEWKAFAAFTVNWLGMPVDAMPFHDGSKKYNRKANSICKLIIDAGNLGHNIDESYRSKYSGLAGNLITFWRRLGEFLKIVSVFPRNTPKFFVGYVFSRL